MDKNDTNIEQPTTGPHAPLAPSSNGRRTLFRAASVGALLIVGWLASGLLLPPSIEIGELAGSTDPLSIKDCNASWLNRKVEGISKRCYLGNIEILKASEDAVFRQYEELATQWPKVFLNTDTEVPPKEVQEFMWPEENFFRRTVNGLSAADDLRSQVTAQGFYTAQLKELSARIRNLQERIDRHKAYAEQKRARQVSPYSVMPDPAAGTAAIKVLGKSGPFNIYDVQPKDDLDALKYFSDHTVYQPEELVKLLPVIEKATAEQHGLTCEYLCADAQGNIVGRTRIHADGSGTK